MLNDGYYEEEEEGEGERRGRGGKREGGEGSKVLGEDDNYWRKRRREREREGEGIEEVQGVKGERMIVMYYFLQEEYIGPEDFQARLVYDSVQYREMLHKVSLSLKY